MTKSEALYQFFNSLGMSAYPSTSDEDLKDRTFPWLTYENVIDCAGSMAVSCAVQLWYHTESEKIPNAKVDQIAESVGMGGKIITYDGGSIWIKRGSPFAQNINDENDTAIKGRLINLYLEYL